MVICGKCNQPAENHPHEWCPYLLDPVDDGAGGIVGYTLKRKPEQDEKR